MQPPKTPFIRIGDFFFKYRNKIFPALLLALFVTFPPAYEYGGSEFLEEQKDFLAVAVVLAGLFLRGMVIGYAYIKRGGLNKEVYADTLVTEGFFTLCRNPLYVGNMLLYFGVFLMHGNPLLIVIGTALFFCIYSAIIAAEEFFLRGKFGEAYDAYCASTPRWRLKLLRFKAATAGMDFSLRRVIAKDYSTIGMALLTLAALELFEIVEFYPFSQIRWQFWLLAGCILAVALLVLLVRTLKKKSALLKV